MLLYIAFKGVGYMNNEYKYSYDEYDDDYYYDDELDDDIEYTSYQDDLENNNN